MSTKIQHRAMLVNLSIAYWTGRAGDERMTDAVVQSSKAERSAVETKKILIHPDALNAPKAVRSRARAYLFAKTSPWIDGGTRILTRAFYFEVMEKMAAFQAEYEDAVHNSVIKNYSKLKGEARKRLGSLYKEEDYPTAEQLKGKYSWSCAVLPIPDKDAWKVGLGDKADAAVKKQIEEQIQDACKVITRDLWERLHKVVAHFAETLKDVDSTFRDSLIGNIKELADILPKMNVTEDPKLEAMTKEVVTALCQFDPAVLRENTKQRKAASSAADDILAKMAGYIGK